MSRKLSDRERQEIADEHWSWIRMIITHAGIGMVLGALTGFLIIYYDVNRLGTMIAKSEYGTGYALLLMFSFGAFFGSIASGISIWMRAERMGR